MMRQTHMKKRTITITKEQIMFLEHYRSNVDTGFKLSRAVQRLIETMMDNEIKKEVKKEKKKEEFLDAI